MVPVQRCSASISCHNADRSRCDISRPQAQHSRHSQAPAAAEAVPACLVAMGALARRVPARSRTYFCSPWDPDNAYCRTKISRLARCFPSMSGHIRLSPLGTQRDILTTGPVGIRSPKGCVRPRLGSKNHQPSRTVGSCKEGGLFRTPKHKGLAIQSRQAAVHPLPGYTLRC